MMPDSFLDGLDEDVPRRQQIWKQGLEEPAPLSCCLVVVSDDEIVGFAFAGPSRDDDATPETGELGGIYLLGAFQGSGTGRALHDTALDRLRVSGFQVATLWVLDANLKTRAWYERQGWIDDNAVKLDPRGEFVLREVRYRKELIAKDPNRKPPDGSLRR